MEEILARPAAAGALRRALQRQVSLPCACTACGSGSIQVLHHVPRCSCSWSSTLHVCRRDRTSRADALCSSLHDLAPACCRASTSASTAFSGQWRRWTWSECWGACAMLQQSLRLACRNGPCRLPRTGTPPATPALHSQPGDWYLHGHPSASSSCCAASDTQSLQGSWCCMPCFRDRVSLTDALIMAVV